MAKRDSLYGGVMYGEKHLAKILIVEIFVIKITDLNSSTSIFIYTQSSRLSIRSNSFSRIGTLTLRNLSKHDIKRR